MTGDTNATTRRSALTATAAASATALTGCLGARGDQSTTTTTREPASLSGTIRIAGSSTVYPLTLAVGNRFSRRHPDVTVSVSSTGTGAGFSKFFCPGRAHLNDASRAITDAERDACADHGVEPVGFRVATDALTVVVDTEADWVSCVSTAELAAVWRADGATRWSDVRPEWPDAPVELYGPTSASGTFDYFRETVLGADAAHRTDYAGTEQDETIVEQVTDDAHAMGYFGFAYFTKNRDAVRAVAVDDGDGCVTPSLSTAGSGAYSPLSRPLYVYVDRQALQSRPVREFLRFYLSLTTTDLVEDVGYVPVSDDVARENERRLRDAVSRVQ
jgi:phosphate transport system substrate-binding protein